MTTGFFYQRTLGFLVPTGGPNLQALYGCRTTGGDYFLSLDAACEGVGALGRYGFVYITPPTGEDTVAVYRCLRADQRHFASLDAACGGATTEARLGYLRTAEQGAAPPPACAPSAARVTIGLGSPAGADDPLRRHRDAVRPGPRPRRQRRPPARRC